MTAAASQAMLTSGFNVLPMLLYGHNLKGL